MVDEVAISAIAVVLQLLTILAGLYYFKTKFPVEKQTAQAEANVDNASAAKQLADASGAWLENYNRMFVMMQERDAELAKQNKRLHELENQQSLHEKELAQERKLREEAQAARITAEAENKDLHRQVDELRGEVRHLKDEINTLKKTTAATESPTI
jgi:chromosome segregation ATPase